RAVDVCPIALSFQAEYKLTGLPAIAELTADDAARLISAAIVNNCTSDGDKVPTIAALTPAAVGTDVETGPVVDRNNHRRRRCLGVGTRGEISSRRGRGHHECEHPNGSETKLLHCHCTSSIPSTEHKRRSITRCRVVVGSNFRA